MRNSSDQAFRKGDVMGRWDEPTYGGALSFLRRKFSRDLNGVDVAVSGVPYDCATTYRPGCRLGPRAIRAASVQLAELEAFPFGFDPFATLAVVDWGDAHIDPHHPETVPRDIEAHAAKIIATETKMLTFGGDHFITYPLIRAHAQKYGPIALIQFDAHCDTWEDDGVKMDHGSMFARAVDEGVIDVTKSTQIGLRTYNNSDHGFEILAAPWVHRNGIDATLEIIKARAGNAPVYISFDIDVLDPAFAPGTG
ncbi:Agmatinase, partial [hydrothermal vent metagenome]